MPGAGPWSAWAGQRAAAGGVVSRAGRRRHRERGRGRGTNPGDAATAALGGVMGLGVDVVSFPFSRGVGVGVGFSVGVSGGIGGRSGRRVSFVGRRRLYRGVGS